MSHDAGLASKKMSVSVSVPGFLPISLPDYLSLLDWTAFHIHGNKRGRIPQAVKPILDRLGLEASAWSKLVHLFKSGPNPITIPPRVAFRKRNMPCGFLRLLATRRIKAGGRFEQGWRW